MRLGDTCANCGAPGGSGPYRGGMDAGQVRVAVKTKPRGVIGVVRGVVVVLAVALCASCVKSDRAGDGGDDQVAAGGVVAVSGGGEPVVVAAEGLVDASFEVTEALVGKAQVVLVVDGSLPELVQVAQAAVGSGVQVPVLFVEPGADHDRLVQELDRLGTETVVTLGDVGQTAGVDQVVLPVAGGVPGEVQQVVAQALPQSPDADVTVLVGSSWGYEVLLATARAVGATVVSGVVAGDPRVQDSVIEALRDSPGDVVVALGAEFGDAGVLASRVVTAQGAAVLPGGGQVLFPYRQMVALYGSPGTPSLGLLGEQDVDGAVVRAKEYAQQYQDLNDKPVVPAFEIITTVASAGAGPNGDYSEPVASEVIRPWIERAQAEGIYVLLDLQPGHTDFLTQAKMYEDLLVYPNVGLALDPEWRLKPGQRHLRQIGSVGIDEVNSVHQWLTDLVAKEGLPQKLLVLHQFKLSMLEGRERVALSNDQVSVLIHVDGNGPPGAKEATWKRMREGAPEVFWGWKNFIDEDAPMMTPAQTMQVEPVPDLVTYQ